MKREQIPDYNKKLVIKDRIFTPVNGVSLNNGIFKRVFENNISFLKQFRLEDLSYWFDVKSGRVAKGSPFRGHFEDNLKGQTAFQLLMGAGNALRWTEDVDLEKMLNDVLDVISSSAESDGYCMAVPKSEFPRNEYPHYVRIWLTYGLIAAYLSGNNRALETLKAWQNWFNSSRELPIIKYLELAYQGIVASTAAYMTPIGTQKDLEVVEKYYEEDWRLAQFSRQEKDCVQRRFQPGEEPHPHGSELESLEGYLDMFRATGAYYYLDAVLGAVEMYKKHWQHVGGGIVMCEFLKATEDCNTLDPRRPYNELCCSSFWLHIFQRLHRLFPENESYVSEIEQSLYNVAFANQDEDRSIRYFAVLEGTKVKGQVNSCCSGVGTRIFGSLPEYVFSISETDVYVDLFAAATLTYGRTKIMMETEMPYSGKVKIRIQDVEKPFDLHIRIPNWVPKAFKIGDVDAVPGTYTDIRVTKDLELDFFLEMEFGVHYYSGEAKIRNRNRVCYTYGPLLMAFVGTDDYPYTGAMGISLEDFNPDDINDFIESTDEPLVWKIRGKNAYLKPYMDIAQDEGFVVYPVCK